MNKAKEEFAALQAAKDLLYESGVMNERENHRMQSKLDNLKNGNGRGQWGKRFKEPTDLRRMKGRE